MDEYDQVIQALPSWLARPLLELPSTLAPQVQEVRLRVGCTPMFTVRGAVYAPQELGREGKALQTLRLTPPQMEEILFTLCGGSVHTHQTEIAQGYVTLASGCRAGLGGQFLQTAEQGIVLQELTSVNLRIAREKTIDLPEELRAALQEHFIGMLLVGEPGSGKTTTLLRTLEALKDELHIGVMEADIDSDVDAKTIADAGVKSIQLHTGGMCHLDASMTEQGLKEIGTKDLDLVVLENVGNLVCPAEFDTGAVKNAMILSVPEGHDKPLKYPLIFTVCDALIINKIDVLPYFDFDMEKVVEYAHMRNPKLKIFPLSAKTGEGVDAWCNWLREQVRAWNG